MLKRGKKSTAGGTPLPEPSGITPAPGSDRAEAQAAARRGDGGTVVRLLTSTADSFALAEMLDEALDDVGPEPPTWVTALVAADPADQLARSIQAECLVGQAWAVRGSGWSDTVSQEQFQRFWAILRQADEQIRELLREFPANPIAWRSIFAVSMGLQIAQDERDELFLRSHQHRPFDLKVQLRYHQTISEKWGGSFEKSNGFARWVSDQLPDGDPGHMLIAESHIENVLRRKAEARTPQAVAEIRAALEKSRLASPEWGNDRKGLLGKNLFALAAYNQRDMEVARHLMGLIGLDRDRIVGSWDYYGGESAYLKIGREVGAW